MAARDRAAPAVPTSQTSLLLLALLWGAFSLPAGAEGFRTHIVGYYTSWSIYGRDYHVADIPAEQIDIVNYAFANITDGEIALGDRYADIERWYPGDSWDPDSLRGCFHQLQLLKREHPHLRTLISVGGWTWSTDFSDVALTSESRERFAASCVAFVQEYGFDGVDIDWEYPVCCGDPGNHYRPEDRENFTLLLAELRRQLDAAGDYLLTIAASASPFVIVNYEVELIHVHLDWINVMTYDFHGPWGGGADQLTNHHAPLRVGRDDPNQEPFRSTFNLAAAVETYLERGVLPEKLHAGLPFYGRGYGNVPDVNDGLYAPYSGPAPVGTWEPGTFDYWDLAEHYIDQNDYASFWHADAQVPWLFSPASGVMVSYDDPASIAAKSAYILAQNLGGAMCWEFSADRDRILIGTLHDALCAGETAPDAQPEAAAGAPTVLVLEIRPNPFAPATRITFELGTSGPLAVRIYAADGRLVRTLANQSFEAGPHRLVWDGRDERGRPVPSGIYHCELRGSGAALARRLVRID